MFKLKEYIIGLILVFIPVSAFSQYIVKPFYTHNQSPVIHFFGFPNSEGGRLTPVGVWEVMGHVNIANNASSKRKSHERIYLDGEMFRCDLSLRYGVSSSFEVGLDMPFVRHSSGVLDPIISGWHETFDLPGKARENMPRDAIMYLYQEDDNVMINLKEPHVGMGDISIRGAYKLFSDERYSLALRSLLKLPTGAKKELLGSGTTDLSFELDGSIITGGGEWGSCFFYAGGVMFPGSGGLLDHDQCNSIGFGSLGFAFGLHHKIVPKLQFDWHSALYKESQTKQLGKTSVQIAFGADIVMGSQSGIEIGVSEDIIVNSSPDFVIHLGYSHYF